MKVSVLIQFEPFIYQDKVFVSPQQMFMAIQEYFSSFRCPFYQNQQLDNSEVTVFGKRFALCWKLIPFACDDLTPVLEDPAEESENSIFQQLKSNYLCALLSREEVHPCNLFPLASGLQSRMNQVNSLDDFNAQARFHHEQPISRKNPFQLVGNVSVIDESNVVHFPSFRKFDEGVVDLINPFKRITMKAW